MKGRWLGAAAVFGLAAALVVAKLGSARSDQETPSAGPSASSRAGMPRVVLVAELDSAEEGCGCGSVIRAVRSTSARGINALEIDPRTDQDPARRYRAVVSPTVILMGADGEEVERFEGESAESLQRLEARLSQLESGS